MWVIPKRTPRYPKSLEREYARLLVRYVDENMKGIRTYRDEMKTLVEAYSVRIDGVDITSHIDVLMDRLKNVMKSPEQMRLSIEKIFDRVNAFNLQELETSIKSVLGAMLRDLPNGRVHQDDVNDDLETLKAIWVKQNLDLIKSIDEQTLAKIRQELEREIVGNVAGARKTSELVARIEKIAGVERNRAALIGSDQVGKLNSRLAQYRQQGAGITHYTWQTAHDRRVRPSHQQYDGRTFTWEQGSPEGHPGEPVRCRCVAIPVIDLDKIATNIQNNAFIPIDKNGIINYRKKDNSKEEFHYLSEDRFNAMMVEPKKLGAVIIRNNPDFHERPKITDSSAITYGIEAIVFGENVTISDALEETFHLRQNINKVNDDKPFVERTILNEIEAKKYLLSVSRKYQIPRNETELTRKQLAKYEEDLKELRKNGEKK